MSSLFLSQFADAPSPSAEGRSEDTEEVRSTITVVDEHEPPSVELTPPDWNAVPVDEDTQGGLTTKQLASFVRPSVRGAVVADPGAADVARDDVNTGNSVKGFAPAKEAAGSWGHGTIKIVEGIEPTIREGGRFDGTYFTAGERRSLATDYMTSTVSPDGSVQAVGAARAGDAVTKSQGNGQDSLLNQFLAFQTGGRG
jgi:hypothetical protein